MDVRGKYVVVHQTVDTGDGACAEFGNIVAPYPGVEIEKAAYDGMRAAGKSAAEKAMAEVKADATGDVDSPQFVCIFPTTMLCEQGAMEGVASVLGSDTPVVGIGTLVQFSSTTAPSTTGLAAVLCWPSA